MLYYCIIEASWPELQVKAKLARSLAPSIDHISRSLPTSVHFLMMTMTLLMIALYFEQHFASTFVNYDWRLRALAQLVVGL